MRRSNSHPVAMNVDAQKRAAAARAVEFVQPGMRLGLGTGSTAKHFVELIGERVRSGLSLIAVPTSEADKLSADSVCRRNLDLKRPVGVE